MQRIAATTFIVFLASVFSLHCSEGQKTLEVEEIPSETAPLEGVPLTIGSVSNTIKEEIAEIQPFADYLARRLQAHGIAQGRVVIAQTVQDMVDLLARGDVDLYIDSPLPVAATMVQADARPFLRRWKKRKSEYHSVIFALKSSRLQSLDDLRGKLIAFDERYSTTGHLLPQALIVENGYRLVERSEHDLRSPLPDDRIGYLFSGDDESTLFWVMKGKVAAGVIDNIHFEEFSASEPGQLVALARSAPVPRQAVAHRSDLSPDLVAALEAVLLSMDRDEEGRQVLENFQYTTKFDHFPQDLETTFQPIKDLLRFTELASPTP